MLQHTSLIGNWILIEIDGKEPKQFEIESLQIRFLADGSVSYLGAMAGSFAGIRLEGSREWKIVNNALEYASGNSTTTCKLMVNHAVLSLSPDPIVRPGGNLEVATTYAKNNEGRGFTPRPNNY